MPRFVVEAEASILKFIEAESAEEATTITREYCDSLQDIDTDVCYEIVQVTEDDE